MLSEKQPEYVHPGGSFTPGAAEPEDGDLLGAAAAVVGLDPFEVEMRSLSETAGLVEVAGLTSAARVVDFAGSTCGEAGGPFGDPPEPEQICFVARCGPGWMGLHPGKAGRAPPIVPDRSLAIGSNNPTSSGNAFFARQLSASWLDRIDPGPKQSGESRGAAVLPMLQPFMACASFPTSHPLICSLVRIGIPSISRGGGGSRRFDTYKVHVESEAGWVPLRQHPG